MRRFLCLALVWGLGSAPPAWGGAPAKAPAAPTAEQLIEKLASRDFRERDAAAKALRALGTEALPALQKGRSSQADPEVRRRLEELIPPLERALALAPKRVTLHMTNKPIQDVLNELSKASGYKIARGFFGGPVFFNPGMPGMAPAAPPPPANNAKAVYTFHLDQVPFWEALDRICDAAGLILPQGFWGDDQLHLQPSDSYVPFNSYSGPFKVVATGFYYNRMNHFAQIPRNPAQGGGQQTSETLQVNLLIAVEPKIPIIRVGPVKLTTAEDEEGNSMLPVGNGTNNGMWGPHFYYGGWGRSYVHSTQAMLTWPSKKSRTVKCLRGTIPVTILAEQKPALVTDRILSAKGKKFKVGDANFHIEDVSETPGKQYQIKIDFTENSKEAANDYNRIQFLQQRLELQDDKGNKFSFYLNYHRFGAPAGAGFTIFTQPGSNANLGKPTRLVFYAWNLMEHEVPFEFRDLPLP